VPTERVLVVPRTLDPANRAVAEAAADRLRAALKDSSETIGVAEFLAEAPFVGGALWGPTMVERLERGGWPTSEEAAGLFLRLRIGVVLAVNVTTYEQVWGKFAKFTRVGLDVQAFHVQSNAVVWQVHRDVEVEDKRGRAFQYAMESAVADLLQAVDPRTRLSIMDAWRSWRR
jgi:hypothetical protein